MKFANLLRKIYWYTFRPTTFGVKAIIINSQNQILLVEHKYIDCWLLPGGGINNNESKAEAIKRELKEELNLENLSEPKLFSIYESKMEYKKDHISLFVLHTDASPKTGPEIKNAKYFDLDKLPENTSPSTVKRIKEYLGQEKINHIW